MSITQDVQASFKSKPKYERQLLLHSNCISIIMILTLLNKKRKRNGTSFKNNYKLSSQ